MSGDNFCRVLSSGLEFELQIENFSGVQRTLFHHDIWVYWGEMLSIAISCAGLSLVRSKESEAEWDRKSVV